MNRRDFLISTSSAALLTGAATLLPQNAWATFDPLRPGTLPLSDSNDIQLNALFGEVYQQGLDRLTKEPFCTNFVLADVNFNMKRWFTNFSGDISGRYIEVCSSAAAGWEGKPDFLMEIVDEIVKYQKADGHFGVEADWWGKLDLLNPTDNACMMPILWGNGRLLLGLVAAWDAFQKEVTLASAKKLGDFYVNVVEPRFCDPRRMEEYTVVSPGYASAYVTCVYEGMEGLVQLYRATKDAKYLECAKKMADFHEKFDVLPVRHSHGSLSEHEALMMIYEETGDEKYLNRVVRRWNDAVEGGYVNVCGSVLEKFWVTDDQRDEGCSEADWLRLNLMLWRNTGEDRYLDMAERLLYNGFLANQWPSGGFGHRFIGVDENGPFAYRKYSQESLWCCSFHCPMGMYDFKRYLAVAKDGGIRYNFPMDFCAPVEVNNEKWTISSRRIGAKFGTVVMEITVDGPAGKSVPLAIRKPDWADNVVCEMKNVQAGDKFQIVYRYGVRVETRRLRPVEELKSGTTLAASALRVGPSVLFEMAGGGEKIATLDAKLADGRLVFDFAKLTTMTDLRYNESQRGEGHSFLFNIQIR